jgi:predicted phage tail protein
VALSEHEEALLQQMEEALYAEDPRFASRIEKTKSRGLGRGRVVAGVIAGVAGLALVVFSAMSSAIWLGAVGFAIMVAGIVYAITPSKTKLAAVAADGTPKPRANRTKPGSSKQASFMQRLEERWEKRRRDQW